MIFHQISDNFAQSLSVRAVDVQWFVQQKCLKYEQKIRHCTNTRVNIYYIYKRNKLFTCNITNVKLHFSIYIKGFKFICVFVQFGTLDVIRDVFNTLMSMPKIIKYFSFFPACQCHFFQIFPAVTLCHSLTLLSKNKKKIADPWNRSALFPLLLRQF